MLPPPTGPDVDQMRRYDQICGEVAVVMGAVNVGHGRLVELARYAIDEGLTSGTGIQSPAHWVAWRSRVSLARAKDIVRLAARADEVPCAVAALVAGELTLDQAAMIARHVPAEFDESCTRFAKIATVSQLRKALPRYGFDKPEKADTERRECATGTDDASWWLHGRLPEDQGAVVDQALRAKRDDLYRQRRADRPEGTEVPPVSLADALLALAEDALDAGGAARPGSDRYLVHAHLEAGPDGTLQLATHLGLPLPDHQRRLILCDCSLRGIVRDGLTPLGAGRKTRVINRRMRRAVEHRDGGCAVPGCGRTVGLEIHHIWHWEDGGLTETHNLVCLCRAHHRSHHLDELAITGNPDLPRGTPGALELHDQAGRLLSPTGTPIPRIPQASSRPATTTPGDGATEAARAAGLRPGSYQPPVGEPMRLRDLYFHPDESPSRPTDGDAPPPEDRPPTPGPGRPSTPRPEHRARPESTEPSGPPEANGPPQAA
ncbi:hypothetical protein [Aquihabitans sp. McL0605]|uniref:HNH endonuclease signature motif containing protein n=1 Tax=Aquihabitans sp. McL0605 TaxID=3415671 RepID=UPI003CFB1DE4